jgi:hypothetical protein
MTKRILNEKEYWNISYIKRVAVKIRSACGPLIMGLRKGAELVVNWTEFGKILGDLVLRSDFREGEHT